MPAPGNARPNLALKLILVDLNVVLDVVQRHEPHYTASALVLDGVIRGRVRGCLPAHAFTTIHFLVGRYRDTATAARTVEWLLRWFEVAGVGRGKLERAQQLYDLILVRSEIPLRPRFCEGQT